VTEKQHVTIGRITGKFPETFHPKAVKAFFSFTDRGKSVEVPSEAKQDYENLLDAHKWYEVTNEQMMMSFHECGGFLLADYLRQNLPLAFLIRVFDCCRKGNGFIPWFYYNGWESWKGPKPPEEFERFAPCYVL